ncbi:MAG TPA: rhodanese-like domain-containing protein [Acidimicrobiales bacterium]|nr:rhodanese-like domain-containing protein [Acidimicrobiales bacterium]
MGNAAATTLLSTDELVQLLDSDPDLFMVDVREPDEFTDWQIPGAVNIPLGELAGRASEVPSDRHVVMICAKGLRAGEGAEVLRSRGVTSQVLDGGMGAWASTYDTAEGLFGEATVVQLRRRGKGCLSYVVGAGERALVIDPSLDVDRYLHVAASHRWRITDVLDTHLHADHLSGARALVAKTGATLRLSPFDSFTYPFEPLVDGLTIDLAPNVGLSVAAVSVPGHTEGSTLYKLGDQAIFTGDTLFLESVGRPDLADQAEPFAHHLYRSLHERVLPLSDSVMVFPAHYGAVVAVRVDEFVAKPLGALRSTLPALALSESEFVAWAIKNVKDRPANYKRIVLLNAGSDTIPDDAAEIESGPNRCAIA